MELTKVVQPDKDGNYQLTRGDYGVKITKLHRAWWDGQKWEALEDADFWHDGKLIKWNQLPEDRKKKIYQSGQWKVFDPDWGWV